MAKYTSGRQKNLKVGISSYSENLTSLEVIGNAEVSGVVTAAQFSTGSGSIGIGTDTISGPAIMYIDPSPVGVGTTSGIVRIKGDLYVDGTQFVVNSSTIELADLRVGIATTVGTNLLLDGGGIGIGSTNIIKTFTYNFTSDSLKSSENLDIASGKVYKIGGTEVLSSTQLTVPNIYATGITTVGFITATNLYVSGVGTFLSSGLKIRNPANTFGYTITGDAIAADYTLTLPVVTSNTGIAVTGLAQTFTAAQTFNSTLAAFATIQLSGSTTSNNNLATNSTTATLIVGGPSQTGTMTLGQSTVSQTTNIQAGVSGVGTTKTINFGTGGASGSFTQINIGPGPSAGVGTVVINSGTNLLVGTTTATGTASQPLQVAGGAYVSGNIGIGTTRPTSPLYVVGSTLITGVVTATSFSGNASSATYATSSGIATYATNAGIATYATSSGIATYATSSGIATYATSSGIATYATSSGIATYATSSGIATYATNAGIATALQNARNFSITGNFVNATAISFDGTGNVALAATIPLDAIGLGTYTTGDYVKNISGTSNQITVTGGTGEGSTPTLSIPSQFTAPQDVTVTRDLQVNRNLNVTGNITIGGTTAFINVQQLQVSDPDIVLGFRTDAFGNDVSNDNTAKHGGIAIASTEGNPLVSIYNPGIGESTLPTYKKIMWFPTGSFTGLGTDAWLINYAVGIGSTQFPTGTRLAAGNVQFTQSDLAVVRNINASGVVTATTFIGNLTGTASSIKGGLAGNIHYQTAPDTTAFLANGTATYVLQSNGVGSAPSWVPAAPSSAVTGLVIRDSNNNIVGTSGSISQLTFGTGFGVTAITGAAGIATITLSSNLVGTALSVSGVSTFTNGPVIIGAATSTGTALQRLQVTDGAYVSGSVGIGTTNPSHTLHVQGDVRITGFLRDSANQPGVAGQVLQSTVTGTQWTTAAAGGGGSGKFDTTIDNVLYVQPTGTLDIVGVGTTTTQITTLPAGSNKYIIHSLHVTNVSNGDAEITAGFVMNARKVPATISVGGGAGINTITVGSASSIIVGMAVTGQGNIGETTGIGSTAGFQYNTYVTSVDGNNITLSKPIAGQAVSGTAWFSPVSKVSSRLPVPVGSAVELLKQPMVLNALDSIVLQSTGAGSGIGTTSGNTITYTSGSSVLTVTNQPAAFFNTIAIGNLVQNTGVSTGIQLNTYVGASYTGITTSYAGTGVISIPITKPVNATVGVATALSFTEVVVPEDGALQVTVVYQSSTDTSYLNGTGTVVGIVTLASLAVPGVTSTTPSVYYGTGFTYPSIIQSIRVSNISDGIIYPGGDYPVSVGIGNSDTIFSWLAYNMVIPKNSSIELCEAPKRIGIGQSIFAFSNTPYAIEIQVAGKQKTS